jgi:hypothetical protein
MTDHKDKLITIRHSHKLKKILNIRTVHFIKSLDENNLTECEKQYIDDIYYLMIGEK